MKLNKSKKDFLKELEEMNIHFYTWDFDGSTFMRPDDVEEYLKNPAKWFALAKGVDVETYLAWKDYRASNSNYTSLKDFLKVYHN